MKLARRLAAGFGVVAIAASALVSLPASADEPTKIKFTLDWKIQGVHAWFYWALDKGYFKAENLDVTIDQGDGSAAAVTRVLTGAYQAGFGDMNAVIQTAATQSGDVPVMVYMFYNKAPFALVTKTGSSIKTMKDVEGKTLGAPTGGASYKVFAALAQKNGIDEKKVSWTNMAPNLQEQMLMRDQVEASAVFSITTYMNLVAMGVDPDKDVRWLNFNDYGLDLYSNGVLVSSRLAKDKPKAVSGLLKAVNQAVKECIVQVDACIDNLARNEPLINKSIEKRRLEYTLRTAMLTPEEARLGLGDVDDARMANAIAQIVSSYGLPRTPAAGEVFNRGFLPARLDRVVKGGG